ncbi:BED zinc finger domain-containing protein [Phthorimaea operculella]|nr:BED zinc finger domain-containing protein [Phthorimaea operculella]
MSDTDTETTKLSVWEYFEKCNDELYKAECLLCHKVLNYGSTSHNLKNHLKSMHSDEVDVNSHLFKCTRSRKSASNTKELIKKAFTKVEGDKVAMCNICNKILSYRTTIANLKHHLTRIHPDQYPKFLQLKAEDEDEDYDEEYSETDFQVIEDEDAFVLYNPETDKKNKKRKHEQNDSEVYTEVVYLDEEPKNKTCNSKATTRKSATLYPKRRMISYTTTSEIQSSDEDLRKKYTPVSNELNKFGQYIATLLASMPKPVCTKLQMNIINQVMEEKLRIETDNENQSSTCSQTNSSRNIADEEINDNHEHHDTQTENKKHHKYIITEDADIVKND